MRPSGMRPSGMRPSGPSSRSSMPPSTEPGAEGRDMKRWLLTKSLLCCAWLAGSATAQELVWRPMGSEPEPASRAVPISLGKPQATLPAPSDLPPGKYRGKIFDDPSIAPRSNPRNDGQNDVRSTRQDKTRNTVSAPLFDLVPSVEPTARPISSALSADYLPPVAVVEPVTEAQRGWILVDHRGNPIMEYSRVCDGWQCLPCQRFYAQAEYLHWWTRGQRIPALVTTGPVTTPEDIRGALGAPGTQILFGNERLDALGQSGGRFTAGYWFDDCCQTALEGSYFFLGQGSQNFLATSDQFPVLARPFFNVNTGTQDRQLTASPGTSPGDIFNLTGQISVRMPTFLQGAELNLKRRCLETCNLEVNGLVGFRYLNLQEGLVIQENGQSLRAVEGTDLFNPGTLFQVRDSFGTRNNFYGGQVGASAEWKRDRWFVDGSVKVALGVTHQSLAIDGGQVFIAPDGTASAFTGGPLAAPSNMSHFSGSRFSSARQVGVKLGYQINDNVRVFVGYDFLYWSDVLRPGDQVDTVINVTQVPNFCLNSAFCPPSNAQRPAVLFRNSNFWAQ